MKSGGEKGIRTLDRAIRPYNGLANRRLQPLGHLSALSKDPPASWNRSPAERTALIIKDSRRAPLSSLSDHDELFRSTQLSAKQRIELKKDVAMRRLVLAMAREFARHKAG